MLLVVKISTWVSTPSYNRSVNETFVMSHYDAQNTVLKKRGSANFSFWYQPQIRGYCDTRTNPFFS